MWFFFPYHPCSLPPSLSFLPLGPTRGLLTLSGVWGTAAECSSWKLCRWLIEKAVGLHHFLGLFRVITESEIAGRRELIEYDKPRVVKKIPVLRFSGKEHSTLPFFRSGFGLWDCWDSRWKCGHALGYARIRMHGGYREAETFLQPVSCSSASFTEESTCQDCSRCKSEGSACFLGFGHL